LPKVIIKQGPGTGNEYTIEQAVILGRLDTNDIPVHDAKASREHAKIYRQGEQFAIVDLNSSNGTFVNGEKITKRILKPGDLISIGTVQMAFEEPEADKPKPVSAAQRKSLEDAFDAAKRGETRTAGVGDAKPADIVLQGHQPLQFRRIKPGNPLLGIDLDQLSDTGRLIVYATLVVIFGGLMYLAYMLVAG